MERVRAALEARGVSAPIHTFTTPVPTAAAAAEQLGCPVGAIANSLVFTVGADDVVLVLASGAHRVDTRRVATHLGVARRQVRRADPDRVLAVTGQHVGGVSPVGHDRPLVTLVDAALRAHDVLWAGAGDEHAMFPTGVDELLALTGGTEIDVGG